MAARSASFSMMATPARRVAQELVQRDLEHIAYEQLELGQRHQRGHADLERAIDRGHVQAEGELWLIDRGGPPRLHAKRVSDHHRFMPDGRLLTGDLVVIASPLTVGSDSGDHSIIHLVREGDRKGIWMARLQPRG